MTWIKAASIRAVKTMAQAAIATIGSSMALGDWARAMSAIKQVSATMMILLAVISVSSYMYCGVIPTIRVYMGLFAKTVPIRIL